MQKNPGIFRKFKLTLKRFSNLLFKSKKERTWLPSKILKLQKKTVNGAPNSKDSILIIHPGFSSRRHFNNLDILLQLLSNGVAANNFNFYTLACNGEVRACGFKSFYPEPHEAIAEIPDIECQACNKSHRQRLDNEFYVHLKINEYIDDHDKKEIFELMQRLGPVISYDDLKALSVDSIIIGDLIIESIQRSLLESAHHEYCIEPGTIGYEYVNAGLIYAYASKKIFRMNSFVYAVGNEVGYIEWGIPARFAIKAGVPYIHQTHHYPGEQLLLFRTHTIQATMSRAPFIPPPSDLVKICSTPRLRDYYLRVGAIEYNKFTGISTKKVDMNDLKDLYGPSFNVNNPTVLVFTHLCWDLALSMGDMLYKSNNAWLEDILNIASQKRNVNWVFKIHPAEATLGVSSSNNTESILLSLMRSLGAPNLFIHPSTSKLKTVDIIPLIHAGLTGIGTVALELVINSRPCLLATQNGYSEFDFMYSATSIDEYRRILLNIELLKPPSDDQVYQATCLYGLIFDRNSYLDVSSLFNTKSSSDIAVDESKLSRWLEKNKLIEGLKINSSLT